MLFTESVQSRGTYANIKLQDLPKGQSIYFYIHEIADLESQEYGKFKSVRGLECDVKSAKSVGELLEKAELKAFIPNTFLLNAIDDGRLATKKLYRIEKAWDKGDSYKKGKAKGFGFNIYLQNTDAEFELLANERIHSNQDDETY